MDWLQKVYNWSATRHFLGTCALCGGDLGIGSADAISVGGQRHGSGTALCPGCRADLPDLGPACGRCATPLPFPGTCGPCLRRPPFHDAALAAFHYESPLSDLLIDLKFHGRLALARTLGELLAARLEEADVARPGLIVPVPLHPQRLRERGYNQALELARPVARRLGVPLAPELGVRLRATASQANLDPQARRRNVRGAFGVQGIAPASIAIVDDVITTGSTVAAFAKALRRAGARHIQVWAMARAGH